MLNKKYIVMDLEFNRSSNKYRAEKNDTKLRNEIIEIGAVKLDENLNMIDTFRCYIKPDAYHRVNNDVQKVTEITTEMIWGGKPFTTAAKEFFNWCGDNYEFVTWSENDIFVLEDNMMYHGMDIADLPECYDIQLMFDDQISMYDKRMPLNYAIWKLGFKPAPLHDALNDALNTAEVFRHLDYRDYIEDYAV